MRMGAEPVSFLSEHGLADMISHSLAGQPRLTEDCSVSVALPDLGCEADAAFAFETTLRERKRGVARRGRAT